MGTFIPAFWRNSQIPFCGQYNPTTNQALGDQQHLEKDSSIHLQDWSDKCERQEENNTPEQKEVHYSRTRAENSLCGMKGNSSNALFVIGQSDLGATSCQVPQSDSAVVAPWDDLMNNEQPQSVHQLNVMHVVQEIKAS